MSAESRASAITNGLGDCDYYRGVGSCSMSVGCESAGEPFCITDRPPGGWKARDEQGRFASRSGDEATS